MAFALSWFIPEVPLRKSVTSDGIGESFAVPKDASSLHELAARAADLARRENRHEVYEALAERAGVTLTPDEIWTLHRVDELEPASGADLVERVGPDRERLTPVFRGLRENGLITARRRDGRDPLFALGQRPRRRRGTARARSEQISELLDDWAPETHPEIQRLIAELTRSLVAEAPEPGARAAGVATAAGSRDRPRALGPA